MVMGKREYFTILLTAAHLRIRLMKIGKLYFFRKMLRNVWNFLKQKVLEYVLLLFNFTRLVIIKVGNICIIKGWKLIFICGTEMNTLYILMRHTDVKKAMEIIVQQLFTETAGKFRKIIRKGLVFELL